VQPIDQPDRTVVPDQLLREVLIVRRRSSGNRHQHRLVVLGLSQPQPRLAEVKAA
jgi:hypothetical protein